MFFSGEVSFKRHVFTFNVVSTSNIKTLMLYLLGYVEREKRSNRS